MWRWRVAVIVLTLLIAAAYAAGHRAGRQHVEAKVQRVAVKAAQLALERQEEANQASAKVGAEHEARQVEIRTVYRDLIREVPHVVTPEMDRAYPLSVGWVRLHDAGALGVPLAPDPSGRADDAPSEVDSADAIGIILDNYETANQCRSTVLAWQDWYRSVSR